MALGLGAEVLHLPRESGLVGCHEGPRVDARLVFPLQHADGPTACGAVAVVVVVDGGVLRDDGVFLHRQLRVADEPRVAEGVQCEELGDGTA